MKFKEDSPPSEVFSIHNDEGVSNIVFQAGDNKLEINPDGFFVNGNLTTNNTEIYEAFKSWLEDMGIIPN